jgi:two-component system response regulator DctR
MTPLAHIIDDDEAIRDSLEWLLESRNIPAQSWPSAEAFLAHFDLNHGDAPGCLLLDIRMEGMSGLALFDQLCERGAATPVIFLTGHGDVPMAVGALKRGAFDFVEKPFNDNELANRVSEAMAIDAARRAEQAVSASVADSLAQLTQRERQVMEMVLAGKLNKIIADELSISMRTVEVHRARVFEKMGVKSAVELAQKLKR